MYKVGGDLGVSSPQDLIKGCPIMVGHVRFNQIITNSHRTFACLCTMSIQNSYCDTNNSLIVDFASSKAWFSAQNAP